MTIFAHAVLDPDGRPFDQIRLTGVAATGYHGVLPHERVEGQEFRADVVLHLDARPAASGDALAATVSYADVAEQVHAVLAGSPAELVETVAERIAATVLEHAAVVAVDVRVHKPYAPITVPFADVDVAIRRDRVKGPVVAGPHTEVAGAQPLPPLTPSEHVPFATPTPVSQPVPVPVALPIPAPVPAPVPAESVPPPPPAPVPEPDPVPVVDRLEEDPAEPVEVVLAIGGNVGDVQATLRSAVTDIDRLPGIQVTEVSPLARTTAVGGPQGQPDFLNAVLLARTTLSPRALLRATQAVENAHGRVRDEHWGPRTLDVDIVRYGALVARDDDLELPHPRAHERAFVLVPWAEIQPDADLPGLGGGPVGLLAQTAPDRGGIRWMALDWLTEATPRVGGETGEHPADVAPGGPAVEPSHGLAGQADEPIPGQPSAGYLPSEPIQATQVPFEPQPTVPATFEPPSPPQLHPQPQSQPQAQLQSQPQLQPQAQLQSQPQPQPWSAPAATRFGDSPFDLPSPANPPSASTPALPWAPGAADPVPADDPVPPAPHVGSELWAPRDPDEGR